jgi:RNA polymerase sigma-70 factor (ECF subfamily)
MIDSLTLERIRSGARMRLTLSPPAILTNLLASRWHLPVDEDTQLIERTLSGDRSAFNELVIRHQDRLYSSMIGVTGSAEEAEDVVQDAFVRAFTKLDSFQHGSQFFTWLYRIAFNTALSRHRRHRSRVSLDYTRETTGLEPVDDADSPDEPMMRRERVAMVREAMGQLTEEHRTILVLREMDENSYETIAEILEISIGTVRSRLSRARFQLKLAIEAIQDAEESR